MSFKFTTVKEAQIYFLIQPRKAKLLETACNVLALLLHFKGTSFWCTVHMEKDINDYNVNCRLSKPFLTWVLCLIYTLMDHILQSVFILLISKKKILQGWLHNLTQYLAFSPKLEFRNHNCLKQLKAGSLITMIKQTILLSHAAWVDFSALHTLLILKLLWYC